MHHLQSGPHCDSRAEDKMVAAIQEELQDPRASGVVAEQRADTALHIAVHGRKATLHAADGSAGRARGA